MEALLSAFCSELLCSESLLAAGGIVYWEIHNIVLTARRTREVIRGSQIMKTTMVMRLDQRRVPRDCTVTVRTPTYTLSNLIIWDQH